MINAPLHCEGFILSQHCFDDDEGGTLLVYWVLTDNGPIKLTIPQQRHIFFIESDNAFQLNYCLSRLKGYYTIDPLSLKTFEHRAVSGVYFSSLEHYQQARQWLRQAKLVHYEADIRLADQYLMERFIYGSVTLNGQAVAQHPYFIEANHGRLKPSHYTPTLSTLSLDIECSGTGELFSIGLYNHEYAQVFMIGKTEDNAPDFIHWVSDEQALLQACENAINAIDPDLIIGWNIIDFDMRLLTHRASLYEMTFAIGRDGSAAVFTERYSELSPSSITIQGRLVIDGIDALRSASYNFPSFSLDNVANSLLSKGKKTDHVHNRLAEIEHNFLHNKIALAEYNLEDCKLVLEIFDHTEILDYLILRSQLTGLKLDKSGGSVAAFTNLYLPMLHRAGFISPNLPEDGGLMSPGGYVMDSKPGLYKNVIVLDYKSLYPSIIRTFKIDPLGLIKGLEHFEALPEPDDNTDLGELYGDLVPGFKGAIFSKHEHFLPGIIESFWQQRELAKQHNNQALSQALKIIMNSFYGVLGSGGCRFYDPRLASSITMRGHEIIQRSSQWITDLGYQVIYGDTDSIFVHLPENIATNEALAIGKALAVEINENWQAVITDEFGLDNYLELEFETLYTDFLMPTIRGSDKGSKKRYAGIKHNSSTHEVIFKGMESARTDWTALAHVFQKTLYELIFQGKSPEAYIASTINALRAGELDAQLIYRKRLRQKLTDYKKNIPPHVKAAIRADKINQAQGKQLLYQNKGWIEYVITTSGPEPVEYLQHQPDYDHYIDKQLQPIAEAILPFAGLDFAAISNPQNRLF